MDILFINPRTELGIRTKIFHREPPNGLLVLCAILENLGYDVDFLDLSVKGTDALMEYLTEEPRVVAITSLTNTYNYALEILARVKETSKDICTLYGGPHATFKYAEILQKERNVDFILCGEADLTIIDFISTYFGEKHHFNYSTIPNLAFRKNGKILCNESYTAPDLDNLPFPARHLLDLQDYEVGTIIVNRGCPFNCTFCIRQRIFKEVRLRNVRNICDEMEILEKLGYKFANLYDNINIDEEFTINLCHQIEKRSLNLKWGCELRVDRISKELALRLKQAGCKIVAVGIESGDSEVLKIANKHQSLKRVKKGIRALKAVGLPIQAYFVCGLPGETIDSFHKTQNLIKELKLEQGYDRLNFFAATPYPGTSLYESPKKFGVRILHQNWDEYDNEHIIMDLDTIELKELEENFKYFKKIEGNFNRPSEKRR